MQKVRVVVVDDSAFMRKVIADMISKEDRFEVIAKLRNGKELLDNIEKLNPDLITLDLEMPILNGLDTLKELKKRSLRYPIIMLSSVTKEGSKLTMECLANGAVDFISKPSGSISLDIDKIEDILISKIKDIVQCGYLSKVDNKRTITIDNNNQIFNKEIRKTKVKAIVIGASTGGPKALQKVLTNIDKNIGVPIFIVQHMPKGFTKAFADRLDNICEIKVVEAEIGEKIVPNTVYIAQSGYHMTVEDDMRIHYNEEPTLWGVRPAVDKLFESASRVYKKGLVSVVLTGMGKDGANGTSIVKQNGGITLIEDESTCTIYGMPKAAYATGKVDLSLPLDKIANEVVKLSKGI